ncbi:hypothetical protein GO491_06835 [Flavobacteriaceae bacterium Ap0902]|nr:hypothetical protein [Flavobacteriaceae bacterium Ap0902]
MEKIKFILIVLFSVLFATTPLVNSFAFILESPSETDTCCAQEISLDSILVTKIDEHCALIPDQKTKQSDDKNASKDCNDCDHDCNSNACNSIVPSLVSLDFPILQPTEKWILFPAENVTIFKNQEDIFIDDFLQSIWYPPKV